MTLVLEITWSEAATRVVVFDTATRSDVGEGRTDHVPAIGGEVDPATWWTALVDSTRHAVDGVAAMGITGAEIRTVLIDAGDPPGGLVILDGTGEIVRPALLGSHQDSAADSDWLASRADGGADAWLAATGALPRSGSTAALLSYVHRAHADAWARARSFTVPTGWIAGRLGAESAIGVHDAVGTAVLDRSDSFTWRTDLLATIDPDRDWTASLPRVVEASEPVGRISSDAAAALGIAAGLPIHLGSAAAR